MIKGFQYWILSVILPNFTFHLFTLSLQFSKFYKYYLIDVDAGTAMWHGWALLVYIAVTSYVKLCTVLPIDFWLLIYMCVFQAWYLE